MRESTLHKNIKIGIWLYFILLIFEGALRKWILPFLSQPLLLVRDPLALILVISTIYYRLWKPNGYVLGFWAICLIGFAMTLVFGHGNLLVAIFGFRVFTLHFPLIFIMGKFMQKGDVLKMGKILLYFNIIMTLIVALQFYSPQSAFINRSVGGDLEGGSGFSGAMGFYRVPGTFSFTNGLSLFYGMVIAFTAYFLTTSEKHGVPKLLLTVSTIALVIAVPLTISRAVFVQIALTLFFVIIVSSKNKKIIGRIILGVLLLTIIIIALDNFTFFNTAKTVFLKRFENASNSEGSIFDSIYHRYIDSMLYSLGQIRNYIFGLGLGVGTNVGARFLTGGRGFVISEDEWNRIIGELGLLGLFLIVIRVAFVLKCFKFSWLNLRLQENSLPWLLMSSGTLIMLQGQWGQATSLGFATLYGGMILASMHEKLRFEN